MATLNLNTLDHQDSLSSSSSSPSRGSRKSEEECLIPPHSSPYDTQTRSEDAFVLSSVSPALLSTRRPSLVQRLLHYYRGAYSLRATSHRSAHVKALRLLWCISLLSGESIVYWAMLRRCSWPKNVHWDATHPQSTDIYRIAIIADPQLTDWYSYHQSGFLLTLVQTYTDLYMRRSFSHLHRKLMPDAVLFLGDLLDGGRETTDRTVREQNRERFMERVFQSKYTALNQNPVVVDKDEGDNFSREFLQQDKSKDGDSHESRIMAQSTTAAASEETHYSVDYTNIPLSAREKDEARQSGKSLRLYMAGNHDIGFGNAVIQSMVTQYKKDYGSLNYEIQLGNHSLVVLDTLSFSSNVTSIREESQRFLDSLRQETPTLPRILFTHVPLFRLDTTYCGDQRETSQLILNRDGYQYQNMVTPELSKQILESVWPEAVFSGDDHDWCEIGHAYSKRDEAMEKDDGAAEPSPKMMMTLAPETTLRTFSFAQGIHQPAFVMLSLYNPQGIQSNNFVASPGTRLTGLPAATLGESESGFLARPSGASTFEYGECMLPNQLRIYLVYAGLFALSLGWILVERYRWMTWADSSKSIWSPLLPSLPMRWRTGEDMQPNEDLEQGISSSRGSTTATKLSMVSPSGTPHSQSQQQRMVDDGFEITIVENQEQAAPMLSPTTRKNIGEDDEITPTVAGTLRRPSRSKGPLFSVSESSPLMFTTIVDDPKSLSLLSSWSTSPFCSGLYWKTVGWDLGNIAWVAVPFYIVLFAFSML
ncbi:hypothetical protein BGZ94_009549 [Podila epigama]|nr:hypothetical protein BGZ94_009549 [Podila epigama]